MKTRFVKLGLGTAIVGVGLFVANQQIVSADDNQADPNTAQTSSATTTDPTQPQTDSMQVATSTPTDMAQKLVSADNTVQISNVKYEGSSDASGEFKGGTQVFGFDSGVVLASGSVKDSVEGLNEPGDADIDTMTGSDSHDAAALEFDFVPKYSQLEFKYAFGSEEYPDFVGTQFNDAFAFFVNGNNVATLPNSNEFVSINNVNNGDLNGNNVKNSEYFIDNTDAHLSLPFTTFGGVTKELTISAQVKPNEVNHIKIVIADLSDSILTSFVGISDNSFKSVGKVQVHYIDDASNTIAADDNLDGTTGSTYTANEKSIAGYVFDHWEGNQTGTIGEDPIEIFAVYKTAPITNGSVQVQYVDTDGNALANPIELTGTTGTDFTADIKTFDGYTFDHATPATNGEFDGGQQTVTLVYSKDVVTPTNDVVTPTQSTPEPILTATTVVKTPVATPTKKAAAKLPQTDENRFAAIFLSFLGISGLLVGLGVNRKKTN